MSENVIITEKDRERFRKIVRVMKSATVEGEKQAAEQAAERLARTYGMSVDDMIIETHPELYGDRRSAAEQSARRSSIYEAWASSATRMMDANEAAERYRFKMAQQEAKERGMADEEEKQAKRKRNTPPRFSYYSKSSKAFTKEDRYRLVMGLLKEGVPMKRVADIADTTVNEVAEIYLKSRAS